MGSDATLNSSHNTNIDRIITFIYNNQLIMKLSTATILSLIGTASAFTVPTNNAFTTSLRMADAELEPVSDVEMAAPVVEASGEAALELPKMSQSMPFMERPAALTGALAGDVGFDPLGFAKSEADLMNYREAEVKHARLAMLAAAGWPLSEVFDKKIASAFGMTPLLDASDRAPSVLNGGLGKVSPIYWVVCLAAAGAIDFIGTQKKSEDGYFPGNFGFDPLGAYPKDKEGQEWMQLAEIKNGRLAMIAIFAFAIQEAVSKVGVVDETPFFFFPLLQTLKMYTNSGYIQ